ncbi:hypothetical protein ACIBVL_40785 [Streptomyces sp. NPDC049687]|uniref:hypothetical protein n=1 Tax=Streptomyces sp. NPDC049687 TaxID=3365596 RepID=UPI0037A24E9D
MSISNAFSATPDAVFTAAPREAVGRRDGAPADAVGRAAWLPGDLDIRGIDPRPLGDETFAASVPADRQGPAAQEFTTVLSIMERIFKAV